VDPLALARRAVDQARALLVTAGAGMGVDSGLPDFRGSEGFWRAYPPFRALGLAFEDLANPRWFDQDPGLAWGFYGHRLALYRRTVPHAGFARLLAWSRARPLGAFVYTSNIDGQFQRAGFDPERIVECHGTLERLQCPRGCAPWATPGDLAVAIDEASMRARPPLPACPRCGALARPNVLMFGDWQWHEGHTAAQEARLEAWLRVVDSPGLTVVELGAGTAVPTVRRLGERLAARGATLVRINVREPEGPGIGLALGADEATRRIDERPTSSG
jgi:NAD-dependent SIR2 family protein deacetylase